MILYIFTLFTFASINISQSNTETIISIQRKWWKEFIVPENSLSFAQNSNRNWTNSTLQKNKMKASQNTQYTQFVYHNQNKHTEVNNNTNKEHISDDEDGEREFSARMNNLRDWQTKWKEQLMEKK